MCYCLYFGGWGEREGRGEGITKVMMIPLCFVVLGVLKYEMHGLCNILNNATILILK